MADPASGDNTKAAPEIFDRVHKATQDYFDKVKDRPDPAPRKEPTAK